MKATYQKVLDEYAETTARLSENPDNLAVLAKQQAKLLPMYELVLRIQKLESDIQGNKELESNPDIEIANLAKEELGALEAQKLEAENTLTNMLIPGDPDDDKDIIMEIRAGTGGDEASLFAVELFRAYNKYAESKGFRITMDSSSKSDAGGLKEAIFEIEGSRNSSAYKTFKYESGVHRVQRVPETEKQGRIHTSTITVAVLPKYEEKDYEIAPKDLRMEATTSSGHGGQSVNTTYSAIRITHIPTGITAQCQDERSQTQNREKALMVIRARVAAHYREIEEKKVKDARSAQVGTGDRSEKIRTYNFPQDRVTDHRINQNFSRVAKIMEGDFDDIIDALQKAEADLRKSQAHS